MDGIRTLTTESRDRLQRARVANLSTAGSWAHYATHRARVTDLILAAASSAADPAKDDGELCVLGAGNCNDVDLARLGAVFERIDLVDIDTEAMRAGVDRQRSAGAHVHAHGGIDLSQMSGDDLAALVDHRYDLVASTALLSQLVADAHDAVEGSPLTLQQIVALRTAHLGQMAALMRPGAGGVLVSDLVSSVTAPGLDVTPPAELPRLMRTLIDAGNFFAGVNPYAVCAHLATASGSVRRLGDVTLHPPWIWTMSEQTTRLTYAITFRCVPSSVSTDSTAAARHTPWGRAS